MFKKLAAAVSVAALLAAATPASAHGWHRGGPGFGPLIALGAVAATAVGIAALTAPPAVVYAAPPGLLPAAGLLRALPPAYYGPAPAPTGYGQ
ncbi:MAG: hypothetical protein WDO24_14425 [Pseudomonadota bacterium]